VPTKAEYAAALAKLARDINSSPGKDKDDAVQPSKTKAAIDEAARRIAEGNRMLNTAIGSLDPKLDNVQTAIASSATQANRNKDDVVASAAKTTAAAETTREATRGLAIVNSTTRAGSSAVVGAIYANRPIITTNVRVNATTVSKQVTVVERYGQSGGSRNQNSNGSGTLGNGGR
jgi:hypothetical protein